MRRCVGREHSQFISPLVLLNSSFVNCSCCLCDCSSDRLSLEWQRRAQMLLQAACAVSYFPAGRLQPCLFSSPCCAARFSWHLHSRLIPTREQHARSLPTHGSHLYLHGAFSLIYSWSPSCSVTSRCEETREYLRLGGCDYHPLLHTTSPQS